MKKKVLFIMGCLENGGGERSLINLLNLFDYEKYDIDLVLFKERGLFFDQLPKNVKLIDNLDVLHFMYNDALKNSFNIKHPYLSFMHIYGTIKSKIVTKSGYQKGQYRWKKFYNKVIPELKKEYDIAISYLEGENMYYLVDKVKSKKKIAWIHTQYSKLDSNVDFDLKYFKIVDSIVTISDECKKVLIDNFPSQKEKIYVLPNLTDSNMICSLSEKYYPKEFNINTFNFVSIGRLVHLKGFDLAIEAAKILKDKGLKFTWFVLGSGVLYEKLQNSIIENKLEDFFKLIGSRENPYPYIKNADIIIQPSRYEGKSMVLDESKILCKPIVVTNYDTVHDQINDNEGIIVGFEPKEIAEGIEKMLNEKEKYIKFLNKNEYGNQNDIKLYYEIFEK